MHAPLPTTLRPMRRPAFPTRRRADLPAITASPRPAPAAADHDFLVPNLRPDLTREVSLAGMLER